MSTIEKTVGNQAAGEVSDGGLGRGFCGVCHIAEGVAIRGQRAGGKSSSTQLIRAKGLHIATVVLVVVGQAIIQENRRSHLRSDVEAAQKKRRVQ